MKYSDGANWEEGQQAFRYGAFYLFPPPGIIEAIDRLRQQYDPISSAICQAHISLSQPLSAPPTDQQLDELRRLLSSTDPFEIHYGPLRSFPPYPGVAYGIEPQDRFMELRALVQSVALFASVPPAEQEVAAHITVAEFITVEETDKLLAELQGNVPEGTYPCDAVEYAMPNDAFCFQRVLSLPLGRV